MCEKCPVFFDPCPDVLQALLFAVAETDFRTRPRVLRHIRKKSSCEAAGSPCSSGGG